MVSKEDSRHVLSPLFSLPLPYSHPFFYLLVPLSKGWKRWKKRNSSYIVSAESFSKDTGSQWFCQGLLVPKEPLSLKVFYLRGESTAFSMSLHFKSFYTCTLFNSTTLGGGRQWEFSHLRWEKLAPRGETKASCKRRTKPRRVNHSPLFLVTSGMFKQVNDLSGKASYFMTWTGIDPHTPAKPGLSLKKKIP